MLAIIDYGMGNLGSIRNMLKKIGHNAVVTSRTEDIVAADKIILPGVGAFDNGMRNLESRGLVRVLSDKVLREKVPILGICLGMQLMTKCSEEGTLPGLGWVDARTVRFRFDDTANQRKVPHMGWNTVHVLKENRLFRGMDERTRFYFVHSYHVVLPDEGDVLTRTHYGFDFVSSYQRGNITGVQFHPEKSHKFGMQLLKNFMVL